MREYAIGRFSYHKILHLHLIYNLTIKHIDDSIGIIGIMQRVGYHYDGGAFLVQL